MMLYTTQFLRKAAPGSTESDILREKLIYNRVSMVVVDTLSIHAT